MAEWQHRLDLIANRILNEPEENNNVETYLDDIEWIVTKRRKATSTHSTK